MKVIWIVSAELATSLAPCAWWQPRLVAEVQLAKVLVYAPILSVFLDMAIYSFWLEYAPKRVHLRNAEGEDTDRYLLRTVCVHLQCTGYNHVLYEFRYDNLLLLAQHRSCLQKP